MPPETRPTDGQIRDRAFHLWERRDRPHGHADEFWLQAERELHGEMTGRPGPTRRGFREERIGVRLLLLTMVVLTMVKCDGTSLIAIKMRGIQFKGGYVDFEPDGLRIEVRVPLVQ